MSWSMSRSMHHDQSQLAHMNFLPIFQKPVWLYSLNREQHREAIAPRLSQIFSILPMDKDRYSEFFFKLRTVGNVIPVSVSQNNTQQLELFYVLNNPLSRSGCRIDNHRFTL